MSASRRFAMSPTFPLSNTGSNDEYSNDCSSLAMPSTAAFLIGDKIEGGSVERRKEHRDAQTRESTSSAR